MPVKTQIFQLSPKFETPEVEPKKWPFCLKWAVGLIGEYWLQGPLRVEANIE